MWQARGWSSTQQGTSDAVLVSRCGANSGRAGKGSCWLSRDALPQMASAQEDHVLVGARDGSTHDVKGSQGSA